MFGVENVRIFDYRGEIMFSAETGMVEYESKKAEMFKAARKALRLYQELTVDTHFNAEYFDLGEHGVIDTGEGGVCLDFYGFKHRHTDGYMDTISRLRETVTGLEWTIKEHMQAVVDAETLKEEVQALAEDKDALLQAQCTAIEQVKSLASYMDKGR